MQNDDNRKVSAKEAVDTIENMAGKYPGYRRAHTKGMGFDAEFLPSAQASAYSAAFHLNSQVSAVVRFSHSWPSPDPNELLSPIKGMAVQFQSTDGQLTNLTMANVSVFVTKTPEAFIRLLQVMTKGLLSVREKWRILRRDPEFRTIPAILKKLKPPTSFAAETYHALHSYYLVNGQGEKQAVRFRFEPVDGEEKVGHSSGKDLEKELLDRVRTGPVRFRLVMQLASPKDPIDDPSQKWPDDRPIVYAGELVLRMKRDDEAESFVFDPTAEVEGLECSDDPILRFRSPVYAESSGRRSSEDWLPGQ